MHKYIIALFLACAAQAVHAEDWLLVDTKSRRLFVVRDHKIMESFEHVAIGRNGVTTSKRRDDGRTPLGEFRIGWENSKSRFYRFWGITYPNPLHAVEGFKRRLVSQSQLLDIVQADTEQQTPSQKTPLGGMVGIHGLGNRSPELHRAMNWTLGCIALTNAQIDKLAKWIQPNMRVVIV